MSAGALCLGKRNRNIAVLTPFQGASESW